LAEYFVLHFRSRLYRPKIRLTKADAELLKRYDWPGNVRELQNVIERAMILSTGTRLRLDLPLTQTRSEKQTELLVNSSGTKIVRGDDLKRIERESIVTALERAHWRISGAGGAAELLAINPNTLASRMRSLGIKRKRPD
jgi:DNA-binding NtrC family response regulator